MRLYLKISLLLSFCNCFLSTVAQHPVLSVLEAMHNKDYQYEVDGVIKIPMKVLNKTDTIYLIRKYQIARVGNLASYYELHNNPDDQFQISNGKVITTVDIDPPFMNCACHKFMGPRMFPFYLLEDFYQREVLSSNEMRFVGQDSSSYTLIADGGQLIQWNDLPIKDFSFDHQDLFRDPQQLDI